MCEPTPDHRRDVRRPRTTAVSAVPGVRGVPQRRGRSAAVAGLWLLKPSRWRQPLRSRERISRWLDLHPRRARPSRRWTWSGELGQAGRRCLSGPIRLVAVWLPPIAYWMAPRGIRRSAGALPLLLPGPRRAGSTVARRWWMAWEHWVPDVCHSAPPYSSPRASASTILWVLRVRTPCQTERYGVFGRHRCRLHLPALELLRSIHRGSCRVCRRDARPSGAAGCSSLSVPDVPARRSCRSVWESPSAIGSELVPILEFPPRAPSAVERFCATDPARGSGNRTSSAIPPVSPLHPLFFRLPRAGNRACGIGRLLRPTVYQSPENFTRVVHGNMELPVGILGTLDDGSHDLGGQLLIVEAVAGSGRYEQIA